MSLNLNKVILGGRLVADPELKQTPNGVSVVSVAVAVDRRTSKESEKKTDFIDVVAWRSTAEFISRYFTKGSPVCVVGSIQKRSWKTQNGDTRYATEVIADEAYFVESKGNGQTSTAGSAEPYIPDAYAAPVQPQFEEIGPDEDLPF